ncbi:HEAT repeat domain-containing protein [Hymenobacter lapidiphilus]|uniref:HEAT repeat domain-containing protein n=1 Tax=Hymenobacter lapidiphilus TaxID=2608003 RepID=A0A7Y7PLC6_9BACT|nr:HEAT repeat domain-containing protein [Hymenobacter lapidiphilus]NVO29944.1 HEAT repeat domain-containing protein [Hymenobacter lapidiphilus]
MTTEETHRAPTPLPPACAAVRPLLADYAARQLPPAEVAAAEAHLPACPACQTCLAEYKLLLPLLADSVDELPPLALRDDFLAMLAAEKQTLPAPETLVSPPMAVVRPLWPVGVLDAATVGWLRIAASVALLAVGAALGWLLARQAAPAEATLAANQAEAAQLLARQLTTTSGQPPMASSRIQLVHEASSGPNVHPGDPTVLVLINTLNADPNPNVRLAAAEALYRLRADSLVGPALAQSLAVQTDPNVQITLIEMLVSLRRKQAVPQLQRLAERPDALPVVRQQATQGIGVLL